MATALEPVGGDEQDEVVDLDLDAIDEEIRNESVGKPLAVRMSGKVIHVSHAGDWSTTAMRAAADGDWDAWAAEAIEDPDEYKHWESLNLRNYQIEAVFTKAANDARLDSGKSQRRTGSRPRSRRR